MNKIGLYLDGNDKLPIPPPYLDKWLYAKNIQEFVTILKDFISRYGDLPDLISLNHDLNDEHIMLELKRPSNKPIFYEMYLKNDSGFHAASQLIRMCEENNVVLGRVVAHGLNKTGSENIIKFINEYQEIKGNISRAFNINWEYEK